MSRENTHVGTLADSPSPSNEYRYGIFIRPPAEVALPTLRMMRAARDLFGFHAATAYPPHITLIGSIVLSGTEQELLETVEQALKDRAAISVHGEGLNASIGAAVGIDYNKSRTGDQNNDLGELYEGLRSATVPLRGYEPTDRKASDRRAKEGKEHFRAHLTVLGHDGADNPAVRDEARELLEGIVAEVPADWTADTVTVYRFWSAAWDGKYWLTQEWTPLQSWKLN